jgi:glycosyltransferase involved in cell wall biosynthesis
MFFFVAPSRWMADSLCSSALFRGSSVQVIPNCLDTTAFFPIDKIYAREKLNLPKKKKIILFGSSSPEGSPLKGHQLLEQAFAGFAHNFAEHWPLSEYELVVFGLNKSLIRPLSGIQVRHMGWVDDDRLLTLLYSAADVMVNPSRIESFGQTASESMACGTPVVCFKTSGLSDVLDHRENGFLAAPFEPADLARGIDWVLTDSHRLERLGISARQKAVSCFETGRVARNSNIA